MSWNASWGLYGNADTSISNFLGTTDARPLLIKTSGKVALRVSAGGDVGVGLPGGTRSPDYKLDVGGVLNADEVYKDGTPLIGSRWPEITEGIVYKGGNVGLGTTSPKRALQVGGDVNGVGFAPSEASPNAGYVRWGDNTGWKLHFGRSRESSGGALNAGTAGVLLTLQDNGNVGVGTSAPAARLHVAGGGSIRWGNSGELVADQGASIELGGNNITPGTGTPYIDFHFTGLTQDFNTRIINDANGRLSLVASTLQATGNVGIGTPSPQRALSVNAALNVDQANTNNGAVNPGVTFGSSSGEGVASKRTAGGNQAGLDLYTANAARLSITNGGNVGIGTTAPGARLDVSGSGGAVQCCAPVAPTLSLAEASSSANRQAWLQFHNGGEAEAYIRLAGAGPAGSGREGVRRLEIGDSQGATTSLAVQGRMGVGTTTPGERLHVEGGNIRISQIPADDTTPSLTSLQLMNRGAGGNALYWSLYTAAVGGGFGVNPNSFEIWEYPATNSRFQIRPGGNTILAPAGGNVGVGTLDPQVRLDVAGSVLLSGNHDVTTRRGMLRMGTTDGSQAAADEVVGAVGFWGYGRQHGQLSFRAGRGFELVDRSSNSPNLNYAYDSHPYANLKLRDLLTTGNVGVGIREPRAKLHVAGGLWNPTDTEGDLKVGDETYRLKIGVATGGGGAGDVRIRAHGGTNRLMLGSGTFDTLFVNGARVGVGVMEPQARLHLASEEPQLRLDGAGARTIVQVARGGALQWDFGVGTDAGNGNFWFGDFSAYRLVLEKGTGHIGIGTTDPTHLLHVNGDAVKPGGGFWGFPSDKRLKRGIEPLRDALGRLSRLRGVNFEWRNPEEQGNLTGKQMGLVAQEVEEVLPEWVETDRNGYKILTIRGFEALAVEAFKDLKAQNDELRYRVEALERA